MSVESVQAQAIWTPPQIPSKYDIPLTQGLVAVVDPCDVERVLQFTWYTVKDGRTFYARSRMGGYSPTSMHRFILRLNSSDPEVDHINRNGLDNRRENLRLVTRAQNASNRNVKGFTIIASWDDKPPRYKVSRNGRYVGTFKTEQEARDAYVNAG